MATAIIFAVFGVSALVLHKPDISGCDYDYYVRYLPDGRIKTLLSQSGKPWLQAAEYTFCFFMALSILLTMEALINAPKTAFSDAMWSLWLLLWVMRLAHFSVLRSWHPRGSHWAILCCALMCLVQTLACVFCVIIAFVLVSSSVATLVCISVVPVLLGLVLQLAATGYITNGVRVSKHLYDSGTYTQPSPTAPSDPFGEQPVVHDLANLQ